MSWKTTKPPKSTVNSIRLRYQDSSGNVSSGNFVWSDRENTWIECVEGPDGIGLYEEDGWKVLGWKKLASKQF